MSDIHKTLYRVEEGSITEASIYDAIVEINALDDEYGNRIVYCLAGSPEGARMLAEMYDNKKIPLESYHKMPILNMTLDAVERDIRKASSLRELIERLNNIQHLLSEYDYKNMRLCDLPVFSSNEPKGECDNVFSWDSTHILIWAGQGNGWQLVERTDVGEHV